MNQSSAPINQLEPAETPATSVLAAAPRLSARGLTILLVLMCCVPVVVIAILFAVLPPSPEKTLQAGVRLIGCPDSDYYDTHFAQREPAGDDAVLILKNDSDDEWTHMYLRINRLFSADAYEGEPLAPGEEKVFEISRFQTRTGAQLDLTYNPVRNVEVYARLPSGARAVYVRDFEQD